MDQLDRAWFARQVGLRKLARLIVPRPLQDGIHVQTDARQNLVDLVDRVRLIPAAVVRQRLRVFGLAFRKVVLKDLREIVREAFAVVIVIEVFIGLEPARSSRSFEFITR
jgi:hypothetical protein